jgi:hypothetical protein
MSAVEADRFKRRQAQLKGYADSTVLTNQRSGFRVSRSNPPTSYPLDHLPTAVKCKAGVKTLYSPADQSASDMLDEALMCTP